MSSASRCSTARIEHQKSEPKDLGEKTIEKKHGVIIETAMEARQAEPGPSILLLMTISTGLAVLILGLVWLVFFRT